MVERVWSTVDGSFGCGEPGFAYISERRLESYTCSPTSLNLYN